MHYDCSLCLAPLAYLPPHSSLDLKEGRTALHLAALNDHPSVISLLVKEGCANVHSVDVSADCCCCRRVFRLWSIVKRTSCFSH
jgi:ankyrin repeat protein